VARSIQDILRISAKREDVVNSTVTYIGYSTTVATNTSDPVWQISRVTRQGTEYVTEYADDGNFTQVWDDRTSLFPIPALTNVYSVRFDGVDGNLDGGDIHNYDIANSFSVSMWVKPQNLSGTRILFSKAGSAPNVNGYMLRHNVGGQIYIQLRSSSNRSHTFNSTLTSSVWQHLVFTYSGSSNISGAKLYLNDVIDTNLPGSGGLSGTWLEGQSFKLGSRGSSFYFSGNIDEVTVWDKELTASEVSEIYNSGSPIDPTQHSASGSLASYYKMGDGDIYPTISDNVGSDDLSMVGMVAGDIEEDVP
jgi:hypothetical protein